ncbi:MAG: hypothetical protein Q4D55_11390 [Eubacteriales bacterium]|nr:hypothetical protein [Eubacteriales bacterium]
MRKAKGIFMSLLLALSLCMFTACGNDGDNGNAADETRTEDTQDDAALEEDNTGSGTAEGEVTEDTQEDSGISTTEEPQPSENAGDGMPESGTGNTDPAGDDSAAQPGDGDTVGEDLGDGARAIGEGVGQAAEDVGDAVGDVVEGNP